MNYVCVDLWLLNWVKQTNNVPWNTKHLKLFIYIFYSSLGPVPNKLPEFCRIKNNPKDLHNLSEV